MGEVNYTPEQRSVIDTRDANILVAAAAGSGKTEVLSKRILGLVMDKDHPVDIDRMLILTFTNAAASEMRERITKELNNALLDNPDDERLFRQATLVQAAQITTIDSFCLFVIRNNFSDIELDPGFRIADDGESKLLLQEALEEVLKKHFESPDDDFIRLVESYGKAGDERALEEILTNLHTFVMSNPEPEKWMEEAIRTYDIKDIYELQELPIWKNTEELRDQLIEGGLKALIKADEINKRSDGPASKCKDCIDDYLQLFTSLSESSDYERRQRLINNSEIRTFKGGKAPAGMDLELKAKVTKYRDTAKNILDRLKAYYCISSSLVQSDSRYMLATGKYLMKLLKELIDTFSAMKRDKNILDFSDMEHLALKILVDHIEDGVVHRTPAAEEYRDFFDVIMVDEYQDSNYVQEYIISSIARDNNYFMVGDVKQSIYRFRHACPDIFINKYDRFTESGINTRIDLNANFRSRPEVLDFSNMIFSHVMTRMAAGVEYDDKAALKFGLTAVYGDRDDCDTEVMVLTNSNPSVDYGFDTSKHAAEAYMIAGRIKELINSGFPIYDKQIKDSRPVEYRDIVILLRSTSTWDQSFKKVLESQGIPVFTNIKSGYFASDEVKNILNYLKVLDNPRQDIPFFGVLTSYFGGFTPEEIAIIKASASDESEAPSDNEEVEASLRDDLYTLFTRYDGQELKDKRDAFLDQLNKYRNMTGYTGVRELIENIISETGYLDYVTAFSDGDRRSENLRQLLERASDFQKTSFAGLFRFIRYIDQLKAKEVDYGESSLVSESDNVVRIMTIHASKGLEYPVCFVSGICKGFNLKDASGSVLYDMDYGLGLEYINPDTRIKRTTLQKKLLEDAIKRADKAEEIRVLYVALTRAREKLILTGETDNVAEKIANFDNNISDVNIISASSYFDLIGMALAAEGRTDLIKIVDYKDLYVGSVDSEYKKAGLYADLMTGAYEVDESIRQSIANKTQFDYPYKYLKGLHVKTTVSELKHAHIELEEASKHLFTEHALDNPDDVITNDEAANNESVNNEVANANAINKKIVVFKENEASAYIPEFMREDINETKGTLTGSAYHRVMELIDFKALLSFYDSNGVLDKAKASDYIDELKKKETESCRLAPGYADLVKTYKCVRFLESNLAYRMAKADSQGKLYKEQSFFFGISADRVKEHFPATEKVLMQGVIDVYFEEDGKYVIADYKTDKIASGEELASRYKLQLELYNEALSTITGIEVSDMILYSFALAKEISL